jgi:hypothetical protein
VPATDAAAAAARAPSSAPDQETGCWCLPGVACRRAYVTNVAFWWLAGYINKIDLTTLNDNDRVGGLVVVRFRYHTTSCFAVPTHGRSIRRGKEKVIQSMCSMGRIELICAAEQDSTTRNTTRQKTTRHDAREESFRFASLSLPN